MPIQIICECGKRFSVGDQFAGKRGRCKACGRVVTVPAAQPAKPMVKPGPSPDDLVAAQAPKRNNPSLFAAYPPFSKQDRGGEGKPARVSIHVNPALVLLVILAIGIPSGIYLVEQGPIKAKNQWEKIEPTAEGNITSQITRTIQHEYTAFVADDEAISRRKALNVVFAEPVIMIRLPESVQIQGRTTEGLFVGEFYPHTMRFEASVPILGQIHKVEGSVSDEDQSLNLDGQKIN